MMINIFPKIWPTPPKMSRQQYLRYRLKLLAFLLIWLSILIMMMIFWETLSILLKVVFVVVEYAFFPTMGKIEQVFVSYERYLKEGLW
ncbi:hypothetical protein [Paraherbaspirillum soli]|uniref:DUF4389 domain-containing protein n=1 Tax=Paraherbaspirillum soli TaxID=631222 RepID=A0ABW0MFY7_9BURK